MLKLNIFSLFLNTIKFDEVISEVVIKAQNKQSSYLCAVNVHMATLAQQDLVLKDAINNSTWAVSDGVPITWAMKLIKKNNQERIAGMDLTPRLLEIAESKGLVISVYGNTQKTLDNFRLHIEKNYKNLKIGAFISPPFRALTENEIKCHVAKLNAVNSQIVLVSLGCPKQEKWMFHNSKYINAVCLGIGNAINTTIGDEKRAPKFFQKIGFEWLFRLLQSPRRLFLRYLITNSKFVKICLKEFFSV